MVGVEEDCIGSLVAVGVGWVVGVGIGSGVSTAAVGDGDEIEMISVSGDFSFWLLKNQIPSAAKRTMQLVHIQNLRFRRGQLPFINRFHKELLLLLYCIKL